MKGQIAKLEARQKAIEGVEGCDFERVMLSSQIEACQAVIEQLESKLARQMKQLESLKGETHNGY